MLRRLDCVFAVGLSMARKRELTTIIVIEIPSKRGVFMMKAAPRYKYILALKTFHLVFKSGHLS
jgi:hypothetical protein